MGGCYDYYSLQAFETARQQTADTLRSVDLFTLKTQLYQGICIFWWLEFIDLLIIIGEPRLREK